MLCLNVTNKLKKVIGKVVSNHQHTFVEGRQILHIVLIINKAINLRMKSDIHGIMCKMDIEKTYDHVNWDLLRFGENEIQVEMDEMN